MQLAYADPPYPGCSHLYKDHPDYAGEVDHEALVQRLLAYDGWALSTHSRSLHDILDLCPRDVRVLIWVKNTVRYAWEPVIVSPARVPDGGLRDWIHAEAEAFQWRPKPETHVIGAKPEPFCLWLFAWLGAQGDDEFDDLFPGSGAVGRAWQKFAQQLPLPDVPGNPRSEKRAKARALKQHPRLTGVDSE